jgi:hypothetical protein
MQTSLSVRTAPAEGARDVKAVPFVELHSQRLQGVVSSGSDIERVYVAFFEAETLNYSCNTNNNRPCGGLRGAPCNHLQLLLSEAIAEHGLARVVAFLQLPGDPAAYPDVRAILSRSGQQLQDQASSIFSRFLGDLQLLQHPAEDLPVEGAAWFQA